MEYDCRKSVQGQSTDQKEESEIQFSYWKKVYYNLKTRAFFHWRIASWSSELVYGCNLRVQYVENQLLHLSRNVQYHVSNYCHLEC